MAANSAAVVITAACASASGETACAVTGSRLAVMTKASSRAVIRFLICTSFYFRGYCHLAYSVMLFSTVSLSKLQSLVQA